ncbi:MAG: response regulator [Melioribacteraceae bacterium]
MNLIKRKVLIVDDEADILRSVAKILSELEIDVEAAFDGKGALSMVESISFDIILLDVKMPEMDGFEVCRLLRANEKTKEIPVIFLTAATSKDDIVNGFEVGGQDYITKPFDTRELIERVKTQLKLISQHETLQNMNYILESKVQERTHELKSTLEKLDKANADLLGLDIAKNNFLRLISHEIRTPLVGIIGATSLLEDLKAENKEISEYVEMLKISADRLEEFSTTALIITQLQANNHVIDLKPYKVGNIIDDSIEALKDSIAVKGIVVKKDLSNPLKEIFIEITMIQRALKSIMYPSDQLHLLYFR